MTEIRVDIEGANLERANLDMPGRLGANLKGATANENTIWPDGFDPVAAGVTFD